MLKLLKEIKRLLLQGFASAQEKANVKAMMKELGDEEADTIKDDVASVDNLPEKGDDEPNDDEAVKSIMKTLNSKIDLQVKSEIEKMKTEIDNSLKEFKKAQNKNVRKNVDIDLEKYKAWALSLKDAKTSFSFEIKDVDAFIKASLPGEMSEAENVTGELPQAELDTRVSRDPQREPFIEQLVSVGTINSNLDAWIETTDETGAPLPVAELALLPEKSYDFARKTAEVKKIGVYTKHSSEMAEDLPNLISEVRNFLVADLRRKIDTDILKGNGEGENITGILENAVAYSAGSFAGTIPYANRFDVIETASNQVRVALHNPNVVVVHPTDRSKMRIAKGEDGQYVLPPFIASDGTVISGLRVVANTGIDVGKFLVGDFTKSTVKYKRGLTVEMTNSDQDDFLRDRFTTKATVRLVHRVRENEYEAFVYGDFDTAIASLEETS